MYKDKKILILGAARSGIAAAKVLAKDNKVILTDIKEISLEEETLLYDLGVEFIVCDNQDSLLDDSFDYVVKNPGIKPSHPVIDKCRELGIPVINEMEVAYSYIHEDQFIIGVTGSNGKTTTVTLIDKLLRSLDIDVVVGGNIGTPLCELIDEISTDKVLLLEISDHQLMNLNKFKTNISLLTNIFVSHLDYHGTFDSYKNSKKKIFNNLTSEDVSFINKKNSDSMDLLKDIKSNVKYFNDELNYVTDEGIYIDGKLVYKASDIKLVGLHNYENILSATLVSLELYEDKEYAIDKFREVIKEFNGVEHRIEFVRELNGVCYYNDSKATSPTGTKIALNTFKKPIHLILGGQEQSQDFYSLKNNMNNITKIYAIGENALRVCEYAKDMGIDVIVCNTLSNAVKSVYENASSGDVVLLSPASASFDQFKKFEDRGTLFKELVNKLK